jgi:hypothetical protein
VTEYGLDYPGSIPGAETFHFPVTLRTALGPTQLPLQWVMGARPLGLKRAELETEHSYSASAEVNNSCIYLQSSMRPHFLFRLCSNYLIRRKLRRTSTGESTLKPLIS